MIGHILIHPCKPIKVGLVVLVYEKFFDRWWKSYCKSSPGVDHDLFLAQNASDKLDLHQNPLMALTHPAQKRCIEWHPNHHSRTWYTTYKFWQNDYTHFFFCVDSCWVTGRPGWLLHSLLALLTPGVGMAGAQYVNGNIRSYFWGMPVSVLDRIVWNFPEADDPDTWRRWSEELEHGQYCLSRQVQCMGLNLAQIGTSPLDTMFDGSYEYCLKDLHRIPKECWDEPVDRGILAFEINKHLNNGDRSILPNCEKFFPEVTKMVLARRKEVLGE